MRPSCLLSAALLLCAGCPPPSEIDALPLLACASAEDCDDGNPCTGVEACEAGTCVAGTPVACEDPEVCTVEDGAAACAELCSLPLPPLLPWLASDEVLSFSEPDAEIAVDDGPFAASQPLAVGPELGWLRVQARVPGAECLLDHTYDVREHYPGAAETPGAVAVAADDPRVTGWATSVAAIAHGPGVGDRWRDPAAALGPAEGTSAGVVSLGPGGVLTVAFDPPLADGPGDDLAVFENGFSDTFLELAFVEVSTDGTVFARFDSAARTQDPLEPFDESDPTALGGLAGDVRQGFGTPFDLSLLRYSAPVRTGQLRLDEVRYVRIVDVAGDGRATDSWGRPIHDPFPTRDSAGFDVDAVARLEAPP